MVNNHIRNVLPVLVSSFQVLSDILSNKKSTNLLSSKLKFLSKVFSTLIFTIKNASNIFL